MLNMSIREFVYGPSVNKAWTTFIEEPLKRKDRQMAFRDMLNFLDMCWPRKDKVIPCLVGPVGIGKTEAVMQHAKNHNANVVKIVASQILPTEVSGLVMPNHETHSMDIYDHFRLSKMKDGDILFFDELLEADQSVLKACLTLLESREMMSGTPLPNVQIVAATNPTILPTALAANIRQRFLFQEFDLDREDSTRYIEERFGVIVRDWLFSTFETNSTSYNILSPRQVTKLFEWAFTLKDDWEKLGDWADMIDNLFGWIDIGTKIYTSIKNKYKCDDSETEAEIKRKIRDAVYRIDGTDVDYDVDFASDNLQNIISKLQDLGLWNLISKSLDCEELKPKEEECSND